MDTNIHVTLAMREKARANLIEFGYNVTQEYVNQGIDNLLAGRKPEGIIEMFLETMFKDAAQVNLNEEED